VRREGGEGGNRLGDSGFTVATGEGNRAVSAGQQELPGVRIEGCHEFRYAGWMDFFVIKT